MPLQKSNDHPTPHHPFLAAGYPPSGRWRIFRFVRTGDTSGTKGETGHNRQRTRDCLCCQLWGKGTGVSRGVRLSEVKKICPDAVILPSDYETYSLFSVRMFEILRRFSPDVEEYSIDEAFVDLTGLRRSFHGPYGMIAQKMQEAVEKELGLQYQSESALQRCWQR